MLQNSSSKNYKKFQKILNHVQFSFAAPSGSFKFVSYHPPYLLQCDKEVGAYQGTYPTLSIVSETNQLPRTDKNAKERRKNVELPKQTFN